ncbi:hypothetical protein GCM10010420_52500 [Streptomyces glaucosporus]|uniref:Integral membrane protein n=1 Tax=Streptomyces glaucosporus TaxID=284044 RepID=A0ABP5VZK7_9ACTN
MTGTRRLLWLQLGALIALTGLATALLAAAYDDTHRRPDAVRDRTAPAVLEVAAARSALMSAHVAARGHLASGLTDEAGTDETYRTQIAAAVQSVSQIGDRQVAGEDGRRALSTVNALLVVYQETIVLSVRHAERGALGRAWFHSADTILNRKQTGILARLDELQRDQLDELSEQTKFTGARRAGWESAVAALVLLAVALAAVQVVLYRRFPERLNPWLLAACLILLASVKPVTWAQGTQRLMEDARRELVEVVNRQSGVWADEGFQGKELDRMRNVTAGALKEVTQDMDATADRGTGVAAIVVGGVAVAALSLAGLQRHLRQYRFRW